MNMEPGFEIAILYLTAFNVLLA